MSKITNLIGTTWRLDSESVRGIPAEYGKFNVNANGSFSYLGEPVSVVTTSFNVGYIEQPTQSAPFTDAVSFYVVELNDGGTIEQNVGYMFVNTTQDTVYEFTITGGDDISNPLFIDFINTYGTLVSAPEPEVPTAEGVKAKLQSLITASNAKTGKSDANLTDAVNTLLEGYGQGETPSGSLDITENGTFDVTDKASVNVNVADNPLPIEITTADEMTALLSTAEVGSVYKYTGETTDTYENGALYVVEESE